jgi:coatomer subunit gamma
LEDLELGLCDYIQPLYISDFRKSWEEFGRGNEVIETYSLTAVQGVKGTTFQAFPLNCFSIAAVTTLISLLGMQPCEQTQNIANEKATTHTLLLAGTFIGGVKVLVRCRIAYDPASGVTLEIGVRGADQGVCDRVANCIQQNHLPRIWRCLCNAMHIKKESVRSSSFQDIPEVTHKNSFVDFFS